MTLATLLIAQFITYGGMCTIFTQIILIILQQWRLPRP